MVPAAPHRTRRSPRLTYVTQVRFTQEQAAQLEAVVEHADPPITMSAVVRNAVGVWLINQRGLKGAALQAAVDELLALELEEQ